MGVYGRPDSQFWWYRIPGTSTRVSTGLPRQGGSPEQTRELRRQAETIYIAATSQHVLAKTGLLPAAKPVISFNAFARWFETHHLAHQRSAEKARSMLSRLSLYFDRYADLTQITAAVVTEWKTWRRGQVQPATVNRELDILKALCKAAVPTYLEVNPLVGLSRFRLPESEARVLTYDEEARLLAACGPSDRAFLLAGLDTLLRLGSLLALQWPQVKLDRRIIVPLNAKVSLDAVPISTRLFAALKTLPRTSSYVFAQFHLKGKGTTAAKNHATRRFDALCQLAHVPHGRAAKGLTIHCLRHTGATRALQNGASVRTVMKLGGWKSERTVMRYLHASDADVQAASESIARHVTKP